MTSSAANGFRNEAIAKLTPATLHPTRFRRVFRFLEDMDESLTPGLLAQMDHASLYNARARTPMALQGVISPYEHRAFAREAVAENPLLALPIAAGSLLYQPYKAVFGARSAPSLDQVGQGLLGVGEGIWSALRK